MANKSNQLLIVIPLLWIILIVSHIGIPTNAQSAYRPYRPISNIFGSLFRPPPPLPPPQQQQRRASSAAAPPSNTVSNNNQNNEQSPNKQQQNPSQQSQNPSEDPDAQLTGPSNNPTSNGAGQQRPQQNPSSGANLPPPPPPPITGPLPRGAPNPQRPENKPLPHPARRPPPPPHPHRPRPVPLRGSPPRILLRPQGPLPLIGPLPKRPPPHPHDAANNNINGAPSPSLQSRGQALNLVSSTKTSDESTPASTTASIHHSSHSGHPTIHVSEQDELNAPSTDSTSNNLYIIDELNRAVPGVELHNSLEDTFLPPPTAASFVGSPPGLADLDPESGTLSPGFKVHPRGHSAPYSAPVIISQVPVKSFQSSSQLLKEPMPDKHHPNHNQDNHNHESHDHNHHHHPHDLSTADTKLSEQLTPYPQPRFYDPVSSRTFDRSHHEKRSRGNSKRFHFAQSSDDHSQHQNHHSNHAHHRDDRKLHQNHHDDNHHSHHHNEIIERIDEVIELVDCGGRDLGFCDMSSKYPGHMMGNLMSDCQELVYSGFVPVPDDLEELGDSNPVAKYSNSSKSAVRAQTGSWSWKPYTYESKQVCDSELRFIRPGYARDSTGKWQVVVQTEDLPQRVAIDLCHFPGTPCHSMSDCGRKSRCIQRYNFQHLLAVDPDNLHSCPTIRAFKFPSSCVCHIEYPNHHEDYY